MKLITNDQTYACSGRSGGAGTVRFPLPEGVPAALGETVTLTADNGFVLCEDTVSAWLRWYADENTLVLTNAPVPVPAEPSLAAVQADKLAEVSAACNAAIVAGCDATLADGTSGHLGMTDEDQINLLSALAAVKGGASGYPYHLDGQLCKIYAAADILAMGQAATAHKLYHTTYCNHLNVWIRRCTAVEDVGTITYGAALPADLAANMEAVLNAAGN